MNLAGLALQARPWALRAFGATCIPAAFPPGAGWRFPAQIAPQGEEEAPRLAAPPQDPTPPGLEIHQVTFPGAAPRKEKPDLTRVRSSRSRFQPQAPLLSPLAEAGAAWRAVG